MYTLVQNDQEILRHCKKADQNRCDQQKAQGGRNGILLRVAYSFATKAGSVEAVTGAVAFR